MFVLDVHMMYLTYMCLPANIFHEVGLICRKDPQQVCHIYIILKERSLSMLQYFRRPFRFVLNKRALTGTACQFYIMEDKLYWDHMDTSNIKTRKEDATHAWSATKAPSGSVGPCGRALFVLLLTLYTVRM